MTDYKNTLNLPDTSFPMQASLATCEPERLKRWEAAKLYDQVQQATAGRPQYWFVDGPPYANGDIHIGHAVNKVLKDIVVKCARLAGHQAAFIPGWDCHGLPIELNVEKKHGKVGEKLNAVQFRQAGRDYANEQIARQREDFKRLGVMADWERPYLTMQPAFEAEQLRCLAKIVENGHVVRGFKPVHWCLDCGSSLAEAEVEYADKKSPAIDVKFMAADPADVLRRFGLSSPPPCGEGLGAGVADSDPSPQPPPAGGGGGIGFVIWTTTPWTLPGNEAIAAHPEFDYVLAEFGANGRLIVAERLLEAVAKRFGESPKVLAKVQGKALEHAKAQHPFAGRVVPVILGEHVTLDAGTGLVHTAPAHGVEDYQVGQQYKLPLQNPVANSGKFVEGTPLVAGLHVRKSEEPILAAMLASGALLHQAEITHSYPHCWRHKTPLIFRATPQWFISMDERGLRKTALKGINETRWIPDWGQARIGEMVAGRPDWCISRQRFWGVPLAVFVHREKQSLHPQTAALLRRIADRVEKEGLEAWFGSSAADWLGSETGEYDKSTDTLDVWFDSGVVHQCSFKSVAPEVLKNGFAPVADMYLEGSDQHRGWFMASLLTSAAMHGRAPYKVVLTHGFTVDEQGRKMSKSLGNVVAPQQVTKTLGADVLRLWVAASDYSGEIAISENLLKRMSDAYRRIRNTARYLISNLHGFDPARDMVAPEAMVAVDRWAVAQAAALQEEIKLAYAQSQFHLVYHKLHNYCVVDLGGLYLDLLKDRLYTMPAKSLGRRSAQSAMFHIGEALVRWIAPILSFTADEIWEALPGDRSASVFAQTLYTLPPVEKADAMRWDRLLAVREPVKKVLEDLRIKGAIGSGLQAEIVLYADGPLYDALKSPGEELRFWFITSSVQVQPLAQRPASAAEAKLENGESLWIEARTSSHTKCERCWHYRADVGHNAAHPALCGRCVQNVTGAGETRRFI